MSDSARLESLTYPDGRVLFRDYGTADGLEDRLSTAMRLRETDGSGTILAEYSHTGGGAPVIVDYPQPDLELDLFGGTSGSYAGLDRFRRTIDHRWIDYSTGTVDVARIQYGHDSNSNRLWREAPVADANSVDIDELYAYDGLNRLVSTERGELNGAKDDISTLAFGQDWTLEQLGNWENFQQDDDGNGTPDLD